jgi:hypothetical protein
VVLNRSPEVREAFLKEHAIRKLLHREEVVVWKLLELQRHAMLMYTSCGWFFDEVSGIETVQVIQYAGRVVQLAEELFGQAIEARFAECLSHARSNLPEHRDAALIYEKLVKPAMVDLQKVGAHYGISSLFRSYDDTARVYSYRVDKEDYRIREAGRLRLLLGRSRFTSEITQESDVLTFGVIHFGDHNINGGVRPFRETSAFDTLVKAASEAFSRADLPEVIRQLDKGFGTHTYSLKSLFRDEQRHILSQILISTLDEAEAVYRQLYEHHAPLMRFLGDLKTPLPKAFRTTAEYAINSHLRRAFSADSLDVERIKSLLEEARYGNVDLDATTLEFTYRKTLENFAFRLQEDPLNLDVLSALVEAVELLSALPFPVTLWTVQNVCWDLLQNVRPDIADRAKQSDEDAKLWLEQFQFIADTLSLQVA